jgi:hypothetical protein
MLCAAATAWTAAQLSEWSPPISTGRAPAARHRVPENGVMLRPPDWTGDDDQLVMPVTVVRGQVHLTGPAPVYSAQDQEVLPCICTVLRLHS